jgi:mRNA-degrading endonuclease YafQ of YafQ-DinJ toxin-antitoxin module
MHTHLYQGRNVTFITDADFQKELLFLYEELFDKDTEKFEELMNQFELSLRHLDSDWKTNSKLLTKPKLSTYNYRKYKFFSSKSMQWSPYTTPDCRLIFKYKEEKNEIFLLTIGIRVDKHNNTYLPREHDIYRRSQHRKLPEED